VVAIGGRQMKFGNHVHRRVPWRTRLANYVLEKYINSKPASMNSYFRYKTSPSQLSSVNIGMMAALQAFCFGDSARTLTLLISQDQNTLKLIVYGRTVSLPVKESI